MKTLAAAADSRLPLLIPPPHRCQRRPSMAHQIMITFGECLRQSLSCPLAASVV